MKTINKIFWSALILLVVYTILVLVPTPVNFSITGFVAEGRLPIVGEDSGNWGSVLNTYLTQEHTAEGGHKNVTVQGNLDVSGYGNFTGNLNVTGNLEVGGNVNVTGNLTIGDKITFRLGEVIDNLVVGWLVATGSLNVVGDLNVTGEINSTGLNVDGNAKFEKNINVTGNLTISGNIGIGTTSSTSTLQVNSSNNINSGTNLADGIGAIRISDGTTVGILIDANQIEQMSSSNVLYLNYNSSAKTVINYGGGNVGIGTTNPQKKFHLVGTMRLENIGTTGSAANMFTDPSTGDVFRSTSSSKYKTDINYDGINGDLVFKLKPVSFKDKKTGIEYLGFISEDVDNVEPRLVLYDNEGNPDALHYGQFTALLTKAIQEQQSQILELKQIVCLDHPDAEICK